MSFPIDHPIWQSYFRSDIMEYRWAQVDSAGCEAILCDLDRMDIDVPQSPGPTESGTPTPTEQKPAPFSDEWFAGLSKSSDGIGKHIEELQREREHRISLSDYHLVLKAGNGVSDILDGLKQCLMASESSNTLLSQTGGQRDDVCEMDISPSSPTCIGRNGIEPFFAETPPEYHNECASDGHPKAVRSSLHRSRGEIVIKQLPCGPWCDRTMKRTDEVRVTEVDGLIN